MVWQNTALAADYHHGGAIAFGPDGDLYIGTGDQTNSANAQALNSMHGKILRVHPDGTIPADNPMTILDRGAGLVQITVAGKSGALVLPADAVPLMVAVTFGGQPASAAGKCGEAIFAPDDCRVRLSSRRITCK